MKRDAGEEHAIHKAVRSVKWLALMEIVSRFVSPLVTVILARFLLPEDFGVVATAMVVISFSQMLFEAGLGKALIQIDELSDDACDVVFWSNLVFALIVYPALFASAHAVGVFFGSPETGPVLKVLGLQLVITSLAAVQNALIIRNLEFSKLFWIRLITATIPAFISVPMASIGYGVWALVAGSLLGQAINSVLLWRALPWRPRLRFDTAIAGRMFSFGAWVMLESVAAWLLIWGDTLIVGRLLGVRDLGVYQTGWTLVTAVFAMTLRPIVQVVYPTFSRMQDDPDGIKLSFHRINQLVMSLSFPIGVGLFVVGPEVAAVVFGEHWSGLGIVLRMLGVSLGLAWPVGLNPELYRAMGRPEISAKLLMVTTLIYLPVYFIAARFSLDVFLYARFGLVFVGIAIQAAVYQRILHGSFWYLWHDGRRVLLAVSVMASGTLLVQAAVAPGGFEVPDSVGLVVVVVSGIGLYAVTLWAVDRPFVIESLRLVRRALAA